MSWKSYDQLLTSFKGLSSNSLVSWETIGYSTQGREIIAVKIGNPQGGKVQFNSCIHGGETINAEIMWLYAKFLLTKKHPLITRVLNGNLTIIVPALNPDGYTIAYNNGWGRKNAKGVDLNRNFEKGWGGGSTNPADYDYKGPYALSEKESQVLHNFLQQEKPTWFIDMHAGSPFMLYKASGKWYGLPPEYDIRVSNALNLYKQLCVQSGQNPTEYTIASVGPYGRAMCCAVKHGAMGLLWEFHPTEVNIRSKDPVFEDIERIWLPKFLPLAVAASQNCEQLLAGPM